MENPERFGENITTVEEADHKLRVKQLQTEAGAGGSPYQRNKRKSVLPREGMVINNGMASTSNHLGSVGGAGRFGEAQGFRG